MRQLSRILLLLSVVLGAPAVARAQQATATMDVSAIIDVVFTASAVRDLSFGFVTSGTPQNVAPADAASCANCTSGKWTLAGLFSGNQPTRRNVAISFTQLPTSITSPTGGTLALNWTNAAKTCLSKNGVQYYCYAAYTPVQGATTLFQINGPGEPGAAFEPSGGGRRDMDLYLGGMAAPTVGQRAGYYTGIITVQFAYSN